MKCKLVYILALLMYPIDWRFTEVNHKKKFGQKRTICLKLTKGNRENHWVLNSYYFPAFT